MTVFLYSLLTNRNFEYMWYGNHDLWMSYQSLWIDWRVPLHKESLEALNAAASGLSLDITDSDGSSRQCAENHHWSRPGRSFTTARFYIDPSLYGDRQHARNVFTSQNLMAFGGDADVVLWNLNQGLMSGAFRNPYLSSRLQVGSRRWTTRRVPP